MTTLITSELQITVKTDTTLKLLSVIYIYVVHVPTVGFWLNSFILLNILMKSPEQRDDPAPTNDCNFAFLH